MSLMPSFPVLSAADRWNRYSSRPRRVLILGAGMSGLTAGLELRNLGHDVVILEGRMRAGGRVRTLRTDLAHGLYADLGAARIPENHDWTMKYIHRYQLPLVSFSPTLDDDLHIYQGQRLRVPAGGSVPVSAYRAPITAQENAMSWSELVSHSLGKLQANLGDPTSLDWPPPAIAAYDRLSLKEYIRDVGASPAIADLLMLGWETKQGLDGSVIELIRELALSFGAPRNKIAGGNDLLPARMAEELDGQIRYGVKVLDVRQDDRGVTVITDRQGHRQEWTGEYAICTFPLTVLRNADWIRDWSPGLRQAIREMTYWNLSRSVLQVRERYWKRDGFNGYVKSDQPVEIWDPSYESTATRGMIAAYLKDGDSRALAGATDADKLAFSAALVDNAFPGLHEHLEGGYTQSWGEDPWSLGAHAMGSRGQMTGLLPHLNKPEGRICIAGEHASAYHGWIQGAMESGNRAAMHIHTATD